MKKEGKVVHQIVRRSINKQFVINIIFSILIFCLFFLFIIKNYDLKAEVKSEIRNPYDISVSDIDNFVLLGDSITDFYPIEEFYDDLPVVNSGISGYTTQDILDHLEEMVSIYNPTKVFLLIGTNDIMNEDKSDEVVRNIKKIIEEIHSMRPKAKIYLESIYPVNRTDNEKIDHDMVKKRDNEVIQKINERLKKYCDNTGVTYIDIYSELVDKDGNLDIKYTSDGLHMSNLGYLRVTKTLLPYFQD